MNTFRCPHLDQFARELVDAYHRVEEHDIFCRLAGRKAPKAIEAAHLAMAQHRRECPLCRRLDRETRRH